MKVLFYTNIPSPYRVTFFNELGKYCDLTVVFETASSTERDDAWKKFEFKSFKGVILKGIRTRVDAAFCPGIIKYLKKNEYDHIVVTQLASLTAIWAVAYMRMKGISYYYEGDGGFAGSPKGIKAFFKRFIIKNAKIVSVHLKNLINIVWYMVQKRVKYVAIRLLLLKKRMCLRKHLQKKKKEVIKRN